MALSLGWKSIRSEIDTLKRTLPPSESDLEAACKYRNDPVSWVQDFHLLQDKMGHDVQLDEKQLEVLRSDHKRVLINCHRQWGKSTLSSLLCFHQSQFYPRSLCLLVAPSLRQSSENFRKIQDSLDILEPRPEMKEETKLTLQFTNRSRIISLPGSQKTIRGFSQPDLIVIDEAAQTSEDLLAALFPMLTRNPNGRIIVASTPWGQLNTFYRLWTQGGPEWHKILVRASENPWISQELLAEQRRILGSWEYAQDYECEFVKTESSLFDISTINKMFDDSIEPLVLDEGGY